MRQMNALLSVIIIFIFNNNDAYSGLPGIELYTDQLVRDTGEVVAMWHLDDRFGSTILDESKYHNDGIAFGTAIVPGVLGSARLFNGTSDYIYISDPANNSLDFDSSESFTISLWFKTNSYADYQEVLRKGCAPIPGYIIEIKCGYVYGVIGSKADGRLPDSLISIKSDHTYSDGEWHNVVFVRDKNLYKLFLYVDGKLATNPIDDLPLISIINDRALTIGRWENNNYPCYFSGTLDEIIILKGAYHPTGFNSQILIPSETVINFGKVEIGKTGTKSLIITNISFHDTLTADTAIFDNQHFSAENIPDTIFPGSKNNIQLYYKPDNVGNDSTTMVFSVKDPGISPVSIKLYGNSFMSSPQPIINYITDVSDDPGRQVRIRWFPSSFDSIGITPRVEYYSIWRRVDDLMALGKSDIYKQKSENIININKYQFRNDNLWDYIVSVPAVDFAEYSYVAPTLINATKYGINWSVFQIGAHVDDGMVYFSLPDSGYSIDNEIPPSPTGVNVHWTGNCFELIWDKVTVSDFCMYRIYRSTDELMAPIAKFFIGRTFNPSYQDYGLGDDSIYYYMVTTTDSSENESMTVSAVEGRRYSSGIADDDNFPKEFYLTQNYPNPFNPSTVVEYGIPYSSDLKIVIYDLLGREIMSVYDGVREPGTYRIQLKLDAASGVYFIRMQATAINVPNLIYRNCSKIILKK
jgi:hypothetical protein